MRSARIDLDRPSEVDIEHATARVREFCASDDEDVTVDLVPLGSGVLSIRGRYDPGKD